MCWFFCLYCFFSHSVQRKSLACMMRAATQFFKAADFLRADFFLLFFSFFIFSPCFILWWLWRPVDLDCSLNKFHMYHLFFACSQTLTPSILFHFDWFLHRCLACWFDFLCCCDISKKRSKKTIILFSLPFHLKLCLLRSLSTLVDVTLQRRIV